MTLALAPPAPLLQAIQSIGNLGQQLGQGKEMWMAPLHPFLLQSISRVRDFLDQLVDVDGEEEAGGPARALVPPSVTVREGYLLKRKEEPASLATRFAFKKRYFWLSGETLSYSKSPEWQVRLHSAVEGFPVVAASLHPRGKLRPRMGQGLAQGPVATWQVQTLRPGSAHNLGLTRAHVHARTMKCPSQRALRAAWAPPHPGRR